MANAKELPGYVSLTASHDIANNASNPYGFITIISTMAWGLGYFGMPHILVRFMAVEDEKKLVLSRRIATIWVFIAMGVAIFIGIVSFAWAGFGGAFGAVTLCALFWKRSNKWGALAGMISGGVMVFVWKYMVRPLGGVWNIYELLPAFIVSLVFVVVVSLLTKAPDTDIQREFEEAK